MSPELRDELKALAGDLWWTSRPEANKLWHDLDPDLWHDLGHNPVAILAEARLTDAPPGWEARARELVAAWREELARPFAPGPRVAYFCMEYGLHECLRIYSGGLGFLAGDHVRSAGELGVDFVGIGLFWSEGYFRQLIDHGRQVSAYPPNDTATLPAELVRDEAGEPLMIRVPHGHHTYLARAWKVRVGRARVYLLDTDFAENSPEHRVLTRRLYGGDQHQRVAQEVLLGIGGFRLLEALDIPRDVFHMNEGHSAFLVFELWATAIRAGMDRDRAWQFAKERCVFTTHTPVPAGHDRFGWDVVDPALGGYREHLGLAPGAFMDGGRVRPGDIHEPLCMTVLALKGSRAANGVSALHGEVSREMWEDLHIPIGHITNGVHPTTWLARETVALYDEHLPGWLERIDDVPFWQAATEIPAEAWLSQRRALRGRLVEEVQRRLGRQVLDPERLVIGFARRFAPYKRGDLVFRDPERLRALVEQGLQLVFAGKAHPADLHGQEILAEVVRWSRKAGYRRSIVFLPDYDAGLGRLLTQGADVWLNTPRRPREASGTSGQKAALNGNPNLSVLDGWWPEAWVAAGGETGTIGWTVGEDREWDHVEQQDEADAEDLYRTLEEQVLPAFADPEGWARRMGRVAAVCVPRFNTHRMVRDYVDQLYKG